MFTIRTNLNVIESRWLRQLYWLPLEQDRQTWKMRFEMITQDKNSRLNNSGARALSFGIMG